MTEQTKTRPQETLDFKMSQQTENFAFSPTINLVEKGKWLLALSSFECTISVFNITNDNSSLSITIPGRWESKSTENTSDELNKFLQLRSPELHVKEVRKKISGKKGNNEYRLSDFDT